MCVCVYYVGIENRSPNCSRRGLKNEELVDEYVGWGFGIKFYETLENTPDISNPEKFSGKQKKKNNNHKY